MTCRVALQLPNAWEVQRQRNIDATLTRQGGAPAFRVLPRVLSLRALLDPCMVAAACA